MLIINFFKSIKEIVIVYILQLILIILGYLLYINTQSSPNQTYFITKICPWLLIFFYTAIISFFITKNKIPTSSLNYHQLYKLISLGISISCIFNMLIFLKNSPLNTNYSINFMLMIISSGIIGPIAEEILFRYILLNNLKKYYPSSYSVIISTIVFSLIHLNILKIIYAMIIGFILNILYHKTNNLKVPIIVHITANITSLFLTSFNIYILLLSITLLTIILLTKKEYLC